MAEMAKIFTAPQIEESCLSHTYLHNVCVSVPPKQDQKVSEADPQTTSRYQDQKLKSQYVSSAKQSKN